MNCAGNIYKGSTRDDIKYLSKNGTTVPIDPNWGWTGHKTLSTAAAILEMEYGPRTSERMARNLASWLACQPDNRFVLTSGMLGFFINKWVR